MMETSRWDDILDALSSRYRRQLLVGLLAHNPQDERDVDPLDSFEDDTEADAAEVQLIHRHLPKLADMGFIEWDREAGDISRGPRWEDIAPVLRLVEEHEHELPEGWL